MTNNPGITIAGRRIARDEPPYIIAELSANHNGKLEKALQLIKIARAAGASAVKIQTYRPDTITFNGVSEEFYIKDGLWQGKTLYELYEEAHTPWDWHAPLFEYARKLGITLFSSPFDTTAVDLLESLDTPAYKVASFEAIDLPLIKYIASTGKPMIISTGLADADEIAEAVEAAREGGCKELAILHCVSGYPAPASDYNLYTIQDMIERFGLVTGLSDHTINNVTAIASIAAGASIIEKHVTLDRSNGSPDDSFSLEPGELFALCQDAKTAWEACGKVNYACKSSEQENLKKFRRSLYVVKPVKAGEVFTAENIKSIRPGYGMPPKYYPMILGKQSSKDINPGTALTEDLILD